MSLNEKHPCKKGFQDFSIFLPTLLVHSRDQEEAHPKDQENSNLALLVPPQENRQEDLETDREEVLEVQENHQKDQETGQEMRSTPARGSW